MKDARTRAEEYASKFPVKHIMSGLPERNYDEDLIDAYLAGDSDRERLMKEALDMAHSIGTQYRKAIVKALGMVHDEPKMTPHDAEIIIRSALEMVSVKAKGLDQTAPETYKKLKNDIATARADRQELVDCVLEMAEALLRLGKGGDSSLYKKPGAGGQDSYAGCPGGMRVADSAVLPHASLIQKLRKEREGV